MKASVISVRIAPKKANLIAKMVRGMSVPDAVDALTKTNKKAARIIEQLLRSAMANASHNDKQNAQQMVIKSIIVNQGTAYQRGMPKARGQMRPYRKFLSHIHVVLGFASDEPVKKEKKAKKASANGENAVKKASSTSKGGRKQVGDKNNAETASSSDISSAS